jgi:hypothetical protein
MPRRLGEVFRFGTAMVVSGIAAAPGKSWRMAEHELKRAGGSSRAEWALQEGQGLCTRPAPHLIPKAGLTYK